jgi:hypothetical protein
MVLRPKRAAGEASAATQKLPLPHGSFLVMGLETNREFSHAIRQEGPSDEDGPRISLTFRHIGTLYDAGEGAVWGVGAPTSARAEAEARARARAVLPADERERRERAEAERMIQLFRKRERRPGLRPGLVPARLRGPRPAHPAGGAMTTGRTLYFVNGSIPNWRAMMTLHEKGLAFTPRRLRVMGEPRETRSPEFLAYIRHHEVSLGMVSWRAHRWRMDNAPDARSGPCSWRQVEGRLVILNI